MNDLELMQALIAGKKVREACWIAGNYIFLLDGYIVWDDSENYVGTMISEGSVWEEYQELEEKTPYYRWRLWFNCGNIEEISFFMDESLTLPNGDCFLYKLNSGVKIIKKEKISDAVYKIEGQA